MTKKIIWRRRDILYPFVAEEVVVKTAPIEINLGTVNYGFLSNVIRRNNRI